MEGLLYLEHDVLVSEKKKLGNLSKKPKIGTCAPTVCKLTFEALDFLVGVMVLVGVVVRHQLSSHRLFGKGFSSPFANLCTS